MTLTKTGDIYSQVSFVKCYFTCTCKLAKYNLDILLKEVFSCITN